MIGVNIQMSLRLPEEKDIADAATLAAEITKGIQALGYLVDALTVGGANMPSEHPLASTTTREDNRRLGFQIGEASIAGK